MTIGNHCQHDFLFANQFGRNKYQEAVLKLIEKGHERLELDIDDLRNYDSRLARRCGVAKQYVIASARTQRLSLTQGYNTACRLPSATSPRAWRCREHL